MVEFWNWAIEVKILVAMLLIMIAFLITAKLSDLGDEDFEI